MIIRFGYVAMSVHLQNASPSRTMTATHFKILTDREAAIRKLERIAAENINNTLRHLRYNKAEGIKLYRLSSKLIPLYTHELLTGWNPYVVLDPLFAQLGAYAQEHAMRISFHPDHFTVLNTPREDVLAQALRAMDHHVDMFEAMGLDHRYKCNIHIGGTYGEKSTAGERFVENANNLPQRIRERITLENDDKTFTARETLEVAERIGVPMVFDLHHHQVNNKGERAEDLWPDIQSTWKDEAHEPLLVPKMHLSSPKSERDPRGHADYVDAASFLAFAQSIAPQTPHLDVMIEAKRKDDALFRLVRELVRSPAVNKIDGATLEI